MGCAPHGGSPKGFSLSRRHWQSNAATCAAGYQPRWWISSVACADRSGCRCTIFTAILSAARSFGDSFMADLRKVCIGLRAAACRLPGGNLPYYQGLTAISQFKIKSGSRALRRSRRVTIGLKADAPRPWVLWRSMGNWGWSPALCVVPNTSSGLDLVAESPSVRVDYCAVLLVAGSVRFGIQVEKPTCGGKRGAPTSARRAAAEGARSYSAHELRSLVPDPAVSVISSVLKAITIIPPETLVRWHRTGFRRYWRWKSRSLGGRPPIDADLRALIWRMSVDNPLWGAPRIHGELLKLGFEVAQSSVAKYIVKRDGPPSQGWLTFLRNHAPNIASR